MLNIQLLLLPGLEPPVVEPVPSYFTDWANQSAESSFICRVSQEERSIFWEVIVSVILSKKFICTCVIFRDRATSLYSSKIVDKKEILRAVSNTGIYCSSDKVGTVHPV
jgi:hypothetical protein